MCIFSIIPFQMLLRKLAPFSEVTRLGRPKRLTQWWRNPEAASIDDASLRGMHCRYLLVLQIAVSKYL